VFVLWEVQDQAGTVLYRSAREQVQEGHSYSVNPSDRVVVSAPPVDPVALVDLPLDLLSEARAILDPEGTIPDTTEGPHR